MLSVTTLSIALGLGLGVVVALAIFASEALASRFVQQGTALDVILRLAVFGVIVLAASELVGAFFGNLVRTHAVAFWLSFCVGFIVPPFLIHMLAKRSGKRGAG